MATVLEKYCKQRENMNAEIAQGAFTVEKLLVYQELLYRINVLETCMNFCKTAPVTPDLRALTDHYQLLDAFIQCMLLERRLGPAGDRKAWHRQCGTSVTVSAEDGNRRQCSESASAGQGKSAHGRQV